MRVILDLRTDTYSVLDDRASALWSVLVGESELDAAIADLICRYDVDAERGRTELAAFAARCVREGLLSADPPAPPSPASPTRAPGGVVTGPPMLRALACLVLTQGSLRKQGFRVTYERYAALPARPSMSSPGAALPAFLRAENLFVARRAPNDCLMRSLALYRFLRSLGIAAAHVIGIRRLPFTAHAWVECDGVPVLDATTAEFTPLARIGRPPPHLAAAG